MAMFGVTVVAAVLLAGRVAAAPAAAGMTTITSQHLTFDYRRYIAIFEDDVVVDDPQIHIEADKLTVLFNTTNEVKAISAVGHVRIRQADKKGVCHKALYFAATAKITLMSDPASHAKAKLTSGDNTVEGDTITFWLNEDKITCSPATVVFTPGQESGDGRDRARAGGLLGPSRPR